MTCLGLGAAPFLGAVLAGLTLASCASTSPTGGGAPPAGAKATAPASPREAFLVKCTRCHTTDRAYGVIDRKETWVKKVAAMASRDLNWIGPADIRLIIAYFEVHPAMVKETFDTKCGRCHRWENLHQLEKNATQWRTMIKFMGRRAPDGLTDDEVDFLARALATSS